MQFLLFSSVTTALHRSSQIRPLSASVTFLFHLGGLVNLPFGISSVTDIVALEILSGYFLNTQNLNSFFIFRFGITDTRNMGKKIRALVRLKDHVLCLNQTSRQPERPQVRAGAMISFVAL